MKETTAASSEMPEQLAVSSLGETRVLCVFFVSSPTALRGGEHVR
jgi:hypothetical protein